MTLLWMPDLASANAEQVQREAAQRSQRVRVFLSDFRAMANQQPPDIRQSLNIYLDYYPDLAVATAENTCQSLSFFNRTITDIEREQEAATSQSTPVNEARRQISNTLALRHFCPNLAQR